MKTHVAEFPQAAHYIWTNAHGAGRNQVAFFRKAFHLAEVPQSLAFHLFADTRYRLIVNGHTLGHGPARFHIAHPQYDQWEIAPYLQEGENIIAIMVHHMGRETFTNDASIGGLIAWGQVTGGDATPISLATDSTWKATLSIAYKSETTRLSNQLGFHESLDARELPTDWTLPNFDASSWSSAALITKASHWGQLQPRSIAPLDESEIEPASLLQTFAVQADQPQQIAALTVILDSDQGWPLQTIPIAFQTFLYSPQVQALALSASAPKCWVNGQALQGQEHQNLLWRYDYTLTLNSGWNSLLLLDQRLGDSIEMAILWPQHANLTLSAERDLQRPSTFRVGTQALESSAPASVNHEGNPDTDFASKPLDFPTPQLLQALADSNLESISQELEHWSLLTAESQMPSPFAARAWEKLVPQGQAAPNEIDPEKQVLLYDFETEVLGRPQLEITAAAGTIIDVLYTERLSDGIAKHGMQGTRMAERYIAREGYQVWHLLHPRGMRYLEVVVRGDLNRFELHRLSLTRANYPAPQVGRFECSDPTLNQIWQVGMDTLYACMEDAYIDCPWRERGVYAGDLLIHFYANLAIYGDHALVRRSITQLFETQDQTTGLLANSSHGLATGLLPDYSAISVQVLWHYWTRTGDIEFVRQLTPQLHHLLQGLRNIEVPGLNLMDGTGRSPYIDLSYGDTDGITCAGNCFQQRAFADGSRLLYLLGDESNAQLWEQHAKEVATAIRETFWNPEQNAFVDRRHEDVTITTPSAPGNILPLLYGIATPNQVEGAFQYVSAAMAQNQRVPNPQLTTELNLTSYFAFYGLQVLYNQQHDLAAQHFIHDNWSRMLEAGAVTWWEYFIDRWSLCHAWSSSPTHFLSTQVLGVRYATPGVPDEVIIEPRPGSLQWAEGIYPHPRGPIAVQWKRNGGEIVLDYQLPEGVKVISPQAN